MLFCIVRTNGAYYHNKGRIILFESEQEAQNFINMFIQYSTERFMHESGNPLDSMKAPMMIMNESQIIPVNFDIDTVECGVVYARELMEKIR